MTEFILNPDFKGKTIETLFTILLSFCEQKKAYKTTSNSKRHRVLKVGSDFIEIKRLDATTTPKLSFGEIKTVLSYFHKGEILSMKSEHYKGSLTSPLHKTPLMSLLLASDIINVTEEKEAAQKYNSIYNRVKKSKTSNINWDKKDFIEWYIKQPKKCSYCNTTQQELIKLNDLCKNELFINKRNKTRGKSLEVDRIYDNIPYQKDNCLLACYWCNNAKTDSFDQEDMKYIGNAIRKALERRLNQIS